MLGQMAWSFEKHWAMLTLNIIRRNNSVAFSLMPFQYESIAKFLWTHITINPLMFFLHMGIQMSIVYSTKRAKSTFVWSVLFVLFHKSGYQSWIFGQKMKISKSVYKVHSLCWIKIAKQRSNPWLYAAVQHVLKFISHSILELLHYAHTNGPFRNSFQCSISDVI